jgi:hypothetical protein
MPSFSNTPPSAAVDAAILAQIAALRHSIESQRNRAIAMWEGCAAPESDAAQECRSALGRYTDELLKSALEDVCG